MKAKYNLIHVFGEEYKIEFCVGNQGFALEYRGTKKNVHGTFQCIKKPLIE